MGLDINDAETLRKDELELPTVTEVSRDLFAEETEGIQDVKLNRDSTIVPFDVDHFLIKNNFQYISLDMLTRQLKDLSDEMMTVLLDRVAANYDSYLNFCKVYQGGNNNDTLFELQKILPDLDSFMNQLRILTEKEMPRTQETVQDTLDYLEKLEEIKALLNNHITISEDMTVLKQLSKSLHTLCDTEPLEEELCIAVTQKLFRLFQKIHTLLETLSELDSQSLHHIRNDFLGISQEFQISLKLLTDITLQHTTDYPKLASLLTDIFHQIKI
ncbi:uncharacterized protein GVI51_L04763 [Nakaseomyces glabratus]|uniref:Conserved oligomeric Golgi complex subunit 2 C-terminal domain-containing protein n=1 Tax=Candida glabrata (strain ATCC 2001 / BCRC 20586 / JCM 3761 / NBRC 0622 / NRRL Y-65 / CBS 138) TaxID=284593 RepID=Q6FLA6_CANGA|nr:uncharacterized protein CAGL0L04884g [Nakaseomyces glabratus]KAH7595471.1 hypothetical protein J7294_04297 [Nakaseomyces glabratus]KAH7601903.1 hypothetical protein J7293_04290 [Nakaseomyces glabratus]QHS68660.1 uncharacterized protein GVI51_L04763 [Nakaseomyces glabratus]CAG61958.1 unnamed protein product [Nakaseomyces glabratus]|eukprot:XP_448988.1 uncharacterized protein CAGL0L04884g [[Candida] glabrata]